MENAMLECTVYFSTKMGTSRIISIDLGEMKCVDITTARVQVCRQRPPTVRAVSRLGIHTFRAKKLARGTAGRLIHEAFDRLNELRRWE